VVPILALAGAVFAFAIFATMLTRWSPKGPQPAAYGHIQTLADLIDDWYVGEGVKMWWGDKGFWKGSVRHAGLSDRRGALGDIQMISFYT
jgi:hypothetical protein